MDKPLSNLDYLIRRQEQQSQRPLSGSKSSSGASSVDEWIEEALVALATPVLKTLQDANGRSTVFELVDRLNVGVDQLRPVVDLIAERFGWVKMERTSLKGDDPVTLTDKGRAYLQKIIP